MAQPPSFYERPSQGARLPQPINTAAPLVEGVDAVARAVTGAQASERQTDEQIRDSDLQVARIDRARDLQRKTGDAAAFIANEQGNLTADLIGMRTKAAPGADGYEASVDQRIAQFRDKVTEHLGTDPDLVSNFVDNIASIGTNARVGETKWAAEQRAAKSVTDSDALQNGLQSNIRTAIAAGNFSEQMMADADALDVRGIKALPIGGNAQEQLIKARHLERIVTRVSASTDVDPHQVVMDIDAGKYGELDDKVLAPLRSHALERANQLDNKAKQAANEAAAIDRANAGNMIEDVGHGVHVDTPTLQGYLARAQASQKPEDIRLAHDLGGAIVKNEITAKYDNSPNPDRASAMREIEGTKDWQSNPALVASHEQLQTLINRDAHAAEQDPISLYARQTGARLPELNIADPAVMRQRFTAADRAAERFQRPVPTIFTEAETKTLRDQYNAAPVAGKADFMLTFGAYGADRARQMMFQIAPNKPELVRLAEMAAARDPAIKSLVREASDGSAVPIKDGAAGRIKAAAQSGDLGAAMQRLPGDRQQAIVQIATWIYAHRAAAEGKASIVDPALASASVIAALGGAGGKGGIGRRNGSAVVLPMGASQDDFDRLLAMGTAHPDVVRGAANGVPTWNGRALHQQEFAGLVPVLVYDDGTSTAYAFRSRGGSGYVKNERGVDYLLDTRKLAAGLSGR